MTGAEELPAWAALPVVLLLLAGAGLALTGSLGLLRFGSFYERVHAPTLGTTLGIGCILAASTLFSTVLQARLVLHGILIAVFIALQRQVAEGFLSGAVKG